MRSRAHNNIFAHSESVKSAYEYINPTDPVNAVDQVNLPLVRAAS